jgi:hypothetical protein
MKYQQIQNKIIELIPHDKCLHFMFGFILAIISLHFFSDIQSIGIIFLIALIKEIRDQIKYKGFDVVDIIFTILPIIILYISNLI